MSRFRYRRCSASRLRRPLRVRRVSSLLSGFRLCRGRGIRRRMRLGGLCLVRRLASLLCRRVRGLRGSLLVYREAILWCCIFVRLCVRLLLLFLLGLGGRGFHPGFHVITLFYLGGRSFIVGTKGERLSYPVYSLWILSYNFIGYVLVVCWWLVGCMLVACWCHLCYLHNS